MSIGKWLIIALAGIFVVAAIYFIAIAPSGVLGRTISPTTSTTPPTSILITYTTSVQTTTSSIPTTTTTIYETSQNTTWATEFFQNVSSTRGALYRYCPLLSRFSQTRFETMSANYELSHYGYAQDFGTYWPEGYTYNGLTYYAFVEEVFYPVNQSPSEFVSQIVSSAPEHWQGLANRNITDYGYYFATGPTYEVLGPAGGMCPVTEIPSAGINIPQFFAQYNCTVKTSNQTYFVMELAPVCPVR